MLFRRGEPSRMLINDTALLCIWKIYNFIHFQMVILSCHLFRSIVSSYCICSTDKLYGRESKQWSHPSWPSWSQSSTGTVILTSCWTATVGRKSETCGWRYSAVTRCLIFLTLISSEWFMCDDTQTGLRNRLDCLESLYDSVRFYVACVVSQWNR